MTEYEGIIIDAEDIEDFLIKVETSFDIKFVAKELVHIKNFGELCDHITNKIQLENSNDCTSQQAFYKLRDAISTTQNIVPKTIATDNLLADFLPEKSRRTVTKKWENHLGFKLNILQPPLWVMRAVGVVFIGSFVGLFFFWQVGASGLAVSAALLWILNKNGNELTVKTVGQLAEKMSRENYLKSRRNSKTFNKQEIEKILIDWLSHDFNIDKSELPRHATFQ